MKILDELESFYHAQYGIDGSMMIQLFGLKEVLRMCRNCRLDKEYPNEYKEIENNIMNKENK